MVLIVMLAVLNVVLFLFSASGITFVLLRRREARRGR